MTDEIRTSAEAAEDAAMPCGHAFHADASETSPEQEPLPKAMAKKPVDQKSPAEWAYERLVLYIQNFEKTLDNEHEIAMGFTDTGAGVLRIQGLGYFDPDMVTFYGIDGSGNKVQQVLHVTQLNVLLRATQKPNPDKAPQRIGFQLAEALESS